MFWKLLKKEVRELINVGAVVSIIVLSIVYGSLGKAFEGTMREATKRPVVGIVNLDGGDLSWLLVDAVSGVSEVVYVGDNVEKAVETVKERNGSAVLVVPEDFSTKLRSGTKATVEVKWIMKGTGLGDTISTAVLSSVIEGAKKSLSAQLLGGENAWIILEPIEVRHSTYIRDLLVEGRSPSEIQAMTSMQNVMVPLLIQMVIVMTGSSLITSLAMEKENKTLETLLTMPVGRETIVASKLVASAVTGVVFAGIYMVGFYTYLKPFYKSSPIPMFQLSFGDYVLVGLSLFLSILSGLSLCMLLGLTSSNTKSAGLFTLPVSLLGLISMFINMFKDFPNLSLPLKVLVFAIPFSHPMMAQKLLLYGEKALVVYGLIYMAAFSITLMAFSVKLFNSDYVLLGRPFTIGKLIDKRS